MAGRSCVLRPDAFRTDPGGVTTHPAVSAAVIGPRTVEHLRRRGQLNTANTALESPVPDRTNRVVAPGTDLTPDAAGHAAAVLAEPARRRVAVREP